MPTKFFTNQAGNSLLKKFEGVFTNVPSIKHFDALVGYFRASGYFKVRPFLDKIPKIRILVGINVDQLINYYHQQGQIYLASTDETKQYLLNDLIKNIQEADYDQTTENGIIQFIDDLINEKIEMRAHPSKKIHAKVYIFRPNPFNEYTPCEVITGSSNLTDAGLGANPESNYEFNVSLRDYEDVKFAHDEFESLWVDSVPILHAEAKELKKRTYIRDSFTPFELYIKMLIEYFGKRVDYDPYNIDLLLPPKFIRLKYQSDAANQGYAIMMKHNGFILADVVGLGKTIIAAMIIKKFIYENGTHTKVLVVVPPAIEDGWRKTVRDFELDNHFRFVTTGSLHKVIDKKNYEYPNPEEIDLVVVDESHKFRNDYTEMYISLQEICKTPRLKPAEDGDIRKKVILISATPLNNRPSDIENQLYLFQDRRNSTLESVRNLQDYFKPINEKYKQLSSEETLDVKKLKSLFKKLRNDVIEQLVIRRTRTDIENNNEYLLDLETQGIKFPKVDDPIPMYYELDEELTKLFFDTVSLITNLDGDKNQFDGLGYYRYRAIEFLIKEEDKKIYGNVESISNRLSSIMKTLLVKRLESSFFAFTQSLTRLQKAINNMLDMFGANSVFIAPDLDINDLLEKGFSYDEIESKINDKGGNNKKYKTSSFKSSFIDLLKSDKEKVDKLLRRWKKVKNDPKLEKFAQNIKREFFKKDTNISGKLVIFTESKETAEELLEKLTVVTKKKILTVNSENRKSLEKTIAANFDANLEETEWQDQYDIIITTEVLAEGINLHRSNVIVNYDVPWNSTRLMQRIGRVNRIGSKAEKIYVYNYYPSAHGDDQIHLVNSALRKLQSFHTAFGEDNRIFSLLEEKGEGALFGDKVQKEESETLKYLIELRNFKNRNPKWFKDIEAIPNKSRCGRKVPKNDSNDILLNDDIRYSLTKTTLSYLKSDNHPGIFCLITPEMNIIELNFLQAVDIFSASEDEKTIPLHILHHKQTLESLEHFKSEKTQENIKSVSRKSLSPAENKAINNIRAFVKIANTEQKRNTLNRTIDVIKKGTFASSGLPKAINEFFSKHLGKSDHNIFLDKLFMEVLDKYDLSTNIDTNFIQERLQRSIINPKIVLSQSFGE